MGECRFNDEGWCLDHLRDYALCTSAADALERRADALNEARALAEALVLSHEGHIASLEEEKARLIRTCPPGTCRVQSPALCNCFADPEVAERLARAEAREAAMREAIQAFLQEWDATPVGEVVAKVSTIQKMREAISPDDGRALAAEVEKLREVARVLQNTTPEALRQLVTELFTQGRSAWAYLFTDLATSMDALAKRGEEGENGEVSQ